MSTYLVAFVVSDFKYKKAMSDGGVEVRVYAPEDNLDQVDFALETCPKILDHYNVLFGVDFPLPKLDLIAIPDFSAGAMENWGLITYRMTSLLYSPKETSSSAQQWVAVTIAHELAHQWFGDLVTMKWWNDLWLNEGFASFVENIGVSFVHPEWKMDDQFNLDKMQRSLTLDAHTHSHPIQVDVKDPAEISEIFDTISYNKGASIIRMMKMFIGAQAFNNGIKNYLMKYKYSNADTMNLWEELTKVFYKILYTFQLFDKVYHEFHDAQLRWRLCRYALIL
jgi:aminopeptidase N